jgi:nicotinamidase-related amidase
MAKTSSNHGFDPSKVALLVIDVQRALFSRPTPIHNAEQLLRNINSLIDMWELVGGLVVYIQHSNKRMLVMGTPDWELHPGIRIINSSRLIQKLHGNAFEKTELNDILSSRGIDQVVITGLVTQGCVRATCLGALSLGYRVTLVEDGHSNYRKDAIKIIEEWNQKLSDNGVQLIATDRMSFQEHRAA